jgi:hypothetical protein
MLFGSADARDKRSTKRNGEYVGDSGAYFLIYHDFPREKDRCFGKIPDAVSSNTSMFHGAQRTEYLYIYRISSAAPLFEFPVKLAGRWMTTTTIGRKE